MTSQGNENLALRAAELCRLGRPHIGFGLKEWNSEIMASLRLSKTYADITLVGPETIKNIHDFETVCAEEPERKLAAMLACNHVEGIVRGTIDCFKTYEAYRDLTGESSELILNLLETPQGHQFFISPMSNPEGWEKSERLQLALDISEFLESWGLEPCIAVLTGERHETYSKKKTHDGGVTRTLNKTYEDAEWIVDQLRERKYSAKNWVIESNVAISSGCNVLIEPNGMVGNQVARMLMACGGRMLSATRLRLSRFYEENSRTERNFLFHVKWLVALINQSKVV